MPDNSIKVRVINNYYVNDNSVQEAFKLCPSIYAADDYIIYTSLYGGKPRQMETGIYLEFDHLRYAVFLSNLNHGSLLAQSCYLLGGLQKVEPNSHVRPVFVNIGTNHVQVMKGAPLAELIIFELPTVKFQYEGNLIG